MTLAERARAWRIALRPQSFAVALSPVMVGAALAHGFAAPMDLGLLMAALLAAVLMQAVTNLQNDVGFFERGAERTGSRKGLPRATTLGLLQARSVRRAIWGLAGLSLSLGLWLTVLRGWPVLLLGGGSLLAALAYMGGPRPIAYSPWGEFTVFLFFGWVAVLGTVWLLGAPLVWEAWWLASAVGCLAAAALAVNNLRDRAHDASIARRTFAVVWGVPAARRLYAFLLLAPFGLTLLLAMASAQSWRALPLAVLWSAIQTCRRVWTPEPAEDAQAQHWNPLLMQTFRLLLVYSSLQALGLLLST